MNSATDRKIEFGDAIDPPPAEWSRAHRENYPMATLAALRADCRGPCDAAARRTLTKAQMIWAACNIGSYALAIEGHS